MEKPRRRRIEACAAIAWQHSAARHHWHAGMAPDGGVGTDLHNAAALAISTGRGVEPRLCDAHLPRLKPTLRSGGRRGWLEARLRMVIGRELDEGAARGADLLEWLPAISASRGGHKPMTDPDAIGPDGTVRLRCYLASADSLWFSAGCSGLAGCGHTAPIGVWAAIRLMGSGEATAGQLERRLRCSQCGGQKVFVVLRPDTRPAWMQASEGPRPETRAGLAD